MTNDHSSTIATRLVEGFELVEASFQRCAARLDGCQIGTQSTLTAVLTTRKIDEAIDFVSRQLTHPATRHVMIPFDSCTAFVNNGKNGSDFANYAYYLARRVGSRSVRVVDRPSRVWTNGTVNEALAYEAHIVELYGPDGELIRSVLCMDDGGKWSFATKGTPHHVEESFDYGARRKKDRFATEEARRLLAAFGLPWLDAVTFCNAQEYLLISERYEPGDWQRKIDERACTFAQANDPAHGYYERGLTYVEHMETHAASVIADFERAVSLNPAYKDLVSQHLETARKYVGP